MSTETKIKTLKVRVKDKHAGVLRQWSYGVNQIWNYINELSYRNIKDRYKWLSAFDIHPYTKGSNKIYGLHSGTVQCIATEYVKARGQSGKAKLSWRKSSGARRSLGWVPVNTGHAKHKNGRIFFNKQYFDIWDSWGLGDYTITTASFNEDTQGRWYFNAVVKYKPKQSTANKSIGIDLGCKDTITCSDGTKLQGRWYRQYEKKLAIAQRSNNKKRTRAIHRKIANKRKDDLHKISRQLVDENAFIVVGDVSSKKLARTKMAKSVYDAGWHMFKNMLEYKCDFAGVLFEVVNEAYSSQRCSHCLIIPDSSPKGMSGLGVREWTCSECGTVHDRDVNSANNHLAPGLKRLAGGMTVL